MMLTGNNCSSFTDREKNRILYINGITAICSSACCSIAVILLLVKRLYSFFIYRLAMYQVLGSLFQGFSQVLVLMLINYRDDLYYKVSCDIMGFLLEYSMWVKLLFTVWLTFHLFSYVVFFKNLKNLEWLYLSSSIFFPLLFVWIPFTHHGYGVSGAWCYIRSWKSNCSSDKYTEGIVEQFALYYGPATIALAINLIIIIVMFVVLVCRARKTTQMSESHSLLTSKDKKLEALKQLLPLLAYPLIYFSLMIFPLVNRTYMALSSNISVALLTLHAVAQAVMGFFAGLALILHIVIVQFKLRGRQATTEEDHFSTFSGVTPFTSGAVTRFSLPNETDVESSKDCVQ